MVGRLFCALDLETTSRYATEARIVEVGAALYDPDRHDIPLSFSALCRLPDGVPYSVETQEISGITPADLDRFGRPLPEVLLELSRLLVDHGVERLVNHNGRGYDRIVLQHELALMTSLAPEMRALVDLPWLDTLEDPEFPKRITCRKLPCLAAAYGFLNPFPHRALPDAMTSLKLVEKFPLDELLTRADSPVVILHSQHAFADNDAARELGFHFKAALGKRWLRPTKELDLPALREKAKSLPVAIRRITDVTVDQVRAA